MNQPELSEREQQVLYWMSHGLSNSNIGRKLHLSEDTVKCHNRKLFQKLVASDRAHAVRKGFELGYLHGGQPVRPVEVIPARMTNPERSLVDALVALGWTPPVRVMEPERVS